MPTLYTPTTGDEPDAADLLTFRPMFAYKSSDQSYSTTTLTNDNALVITNIPAVGVWEVFLRAVLSANAAAPNMNTDFTIPSGSDLSTPNYFELTGASGPSLTNANGAVTAIPISTASQPGTKVLLNSGLLTMGGNSGTLQWRACAAAAGTVTVKAGSYLILRQVA